MTMKLLKRISRAVKYFRAINAVENGNFDRAIALLEDLQAQLSGKSAEYHLHLAKAYVQIACSAKAKSNLIKARNILETGGRYSDPDKQYLIRYTHELLLDHMPATFSSDTKSALWSALPLKPDLQCVDASLMKVFPVRIDKLAND